MRKIFTWRRLPRETTDEHFPVKSDISDFVIMIVVDNSEWLFHVIFLNPQYYIIRYLGFSDFPKKNSQQFIICDHFVMKF